MRVVSVSNTLPFCQITNDGTNQQYQEGQGWMTQFGACCTMTYACLLLFSGIFVYLIRRRTGRNPELAHDVYDGGDGTTHDVDKGSRDSSVTSNDYQREPSSQHEEQREPNHIKATWTFY